MAIVTAAQARLFKRQIRAFYGRSYVPLVTGDTTISIGDLLQSRRDIVPIFDGEGFSPEARRYASSTKTFSNLSAGKNIQLQFTAKGGASVEGTQLAIDKAGMSVSFGKKTSMFLKLQGVHQRSLADFALLRGEVIERFVEGDLSPRVYVVRGVVYADRYFLAFNGANGGQVGLEFDGGYEAGMAQARVKADFTVKWLHEVGYTIDAPDGGPLAYRVSAIRLRRHKRSERLQRMILAGHSEADALASLSPMERRALVDADGLDVVDATDELVEQMIDSEDD